MEHASGYTCNSMKSDPVTRVIMWCPPRSGSTALLKSLTLIPNSQMWCEPFCWANYSAPDGKYKEFMEWFKDSWGVDEDKFDSVAGGYLGRVCPYRWIKEQMESNPPGVKVIFVKELSFGFYGQDYDLIPNGFRHTFLIRHPYKVFSSWKRMINRGVIDASKQMTLTDQPEFILPKGYHFKEVYDMYQHVKKHIDPNPVILDVDDLLNDPANVLKAYCETVGIPYSDDMLKWEAGRKCMDERWMVSKEEIVADHHGGHNRETFASTSFIKPKPNPKRSELDDDVLHCSDSSMGYYKEMHEKRLKV